MNGRPSQAERGLSAPQPDDPAFLAWSRKLGKPINGSTPWGEVRELLAQYGYELREATRREDEARTRKARDAEALVNRGSVWARFIPPRPTNDENERLREKIRAGWRTGAPSLMREAETDVNDAVPLRRWVYGSHGSDRDIDRWTYMRHYLYAFHNVWGTGPPSEEQLLEEVLRQEKFYLAELERQAAQLERAVRPSRQLAALRAWAKKQPMNPADAFEPGIAYYDLEATATKPDWVDKDIQDIVQNDYTITISYKRGKSLSFPAKSLDFDGKYANSVIEAFARRHKASGRLVPFVLYAPTTDLYAGVPNVDALAPRDRVLLGLPYMLTPAVQAFYAQDPFLQAAGGLLGVLKILAFQRAGTIAVPALTRGVAAGYSLTARAAGVTRAVTGQITFAVRTYGFSAQAGAYIGRSAYTYYLTNAVALNTGAVVGADILLSVTGQDMGPISPGDTMTMAVRTDDAIRAGAKHWKAVRVEVGSIDAAAGTAVVRVKSAEPITEDVLKVEYEYGKKVTGQSKTLNQTTRAVDNTAVDARAAKGPSPAGNRLGTPPRTKKIPKGKTRAQLPPSRPQATSVSELENAMTKVTAGLGKLSAKYNPKALEKIRNLSADALLASGIRPSDLAKLPNSLSRAGPTVRSFVNDFHDAPGFEQVLLSWATRHYWNTRPKVPVWKKTEAFRTGSSFVMKYSVKRLDPAHVRFEWPVSINTTRAGDEVRARYVDIVVTGGTTVKPGQRIQVELKSWTEFVLRRKTGFRPGTSTKYPGTVGYQLLRDTALFSPNNIRWVFDGSKIHRGDANAAKSKIVGLFEQIILDDPYLRAQWGGKYASPAHIRELLDRVIHVL